MGSCGKVADAYKCMPKQALLTISMSRLLRLVNSYDGAFGMFSAVSGCTAEKLLQLQPSSSADLLGNSACLVILVCESLTALIKVVMIGPKMTSIQPRSTHETPKRKPDVEEKCQNCRLCYERRRIKHKISVFY